MARLVIFRGDNGQWYWRLRASNGKTIADGSEGYSTRSNAKRAAKAAAKRMLAATYLPFIEHP